jgi:tRNA A37 N6-isopentenylltransferase MiaA
MMSGKHSCDDVKIAKKQNVNKDKIEILLGGTGLNARGILHDRTRLDHSKECSKKLRKWRDQKTTENSQYA